MSKDFEEGVFLIPKRSVSFSTLRGTRSRRAVRPAIVPWPPSGDCRAPLYYQTIYQSIRPQATHVQFFSHCWRERHSPRNKGFPQSQPRPPKGRRTYVCTIPAVGTSRGPPQSNGHSPTHVSCGLLPFNLGSVGPVDHIANPWLLHHTTLHCPKSSIIMAPLLPCSIKQHCRRFTRG